MLPKYLDQYSRRIVTVRTRAVLILAIILASVFFFSGCAVIDKFQGPIGEAFGRVLVKSDYCGVPVSERQEFLGIVNTAAQEEAVKQGPPAKAPTVAAICP